MMLPLADVYKLYCFAVRNLPAFQAAIVLGGIVLKPHRARGFLEIAFCVVRKEEQRSGVGSRLLARLKEHALTLGVLHLQCSSLLAYVLKRSLTGELVRQQLSDSIDG